MVHLVHGDYSSCLCFRDGYANIISPSWVSRFIIECSRVMFLSVSQSFGLSIALSLLLNLSLCIPLSFSHVNPYTYTCTYLLIQSFSVLISTQCFPCKISDLASAEPQFTMWPSSVLPRHVSTEGAGLFWLLCYLHTDTTKEITQSWKEMPKP